MGVISNIKTMLLAMATSLVCSSANAQAVGSAPITPPSAKTSLVYVKTNLLLDAAAVPNLGIAFNLGKNISLGATGWLAWWDNDAKHRFWRTYGAEVEASKYLGKRAAQQTFSGHHVGLYGQALVYDFAWGGRGYQSDTWSYGGGLSYGYSLPIAEQLNLDFTIGIGYLGGQYKEYTPQDDHYVWDKTKMRHWFGPTKAEVSLIWILGNREKQRSLSEAQSKGGKR